MTINITRGDSGEIVIRAFDKADNEGEKLYEFQAGEVVRLKVFEKNGCDTVVLQKDFPIEEATESVSIILTEYDTRIGEIINKPVDYWYEIELNPFTEPQTIVGYDDDGAKIFRLYPEGKDIEYIPPTEEEIGTVDKDLSLTSERPIQNQAVSRAIVELKAVVKTNDEKTTNVLAEISENVDTASKEIAKVNARVTNLARLEEGSTTADAELLDIRVGYDGTVYASAGESVREQVGQVSAQTKELNRLVKGELTYNIIKNEYVTTSGEIVAYTGWDRTDYIDCSGVSTLYIERNGFAGNEYNAFYDANKQFISRFGSYKNTQSVPENAVYFIMSASATDLPKIKVTVDDSLNDKIENVAKECSEKVASVNHIEPDENGNINIEVSAQSSTSETDMECYFVRKEMKPYFTDYPVNVTDMNADSYIDGKISSVPSGDSFLFVTDMHYTENNKNSLLPMLYAHKRLGLNAVLHGGDVLEVENTKEEGAIELRKWTNDMRSCFGKGLLPVFGNHDANWAGISFGSATDEQKEATIIPYAVVENIFLNGYRNVVVQETDEKIRERYANWLDDITDNNDKEEFVAWCKLHYYYDDIAHKTRHIILNRVGFSPIFKKYFRGLDIELKLQFEWLYDALLGTPDDYNVVVTVHFLTEWETNSITNVPALNVMKLLSLAKTNGSGSFSVATGWNNNAQVTQSKTFDFTGRNRTGKIICLCGHSHWDYSCVCHTVNGTYKSEDYTDNLVIGDDGILCIMTQTDAIRSANYDMSQYPATSVQATMTNDTVTEQCFDIVTITEDNVVCTRIGAGNDRVYAY